MGIILLFFLFCMVFCDGLGIDVKPRVTMCVCVCECVCQWKCVCLDVYEWLWGGVYSISSLLVHYSSSEAGNLEHYLTVGSVTIHLTAISAKLLSCPPFYHQVLSPFLYVLSSSVALVTRQWTALCPAKAALFCLSGLFYPRANRHGRVPELDPIFHAQLSFVWHTAPDKNPNSRASLILKSNSGAERAFNHPLSVLQWLPFNLPGSMLLITQPQSWGHPLKEPTSLNACVTCKHIHRYFWCRLETAPRWMLLGNVSEMSLIVLRWNLLVSDVALGFLGVLWRHLVTLLGLFVPKWPLNLQFSLFFFFVRRLGLLFFFLPCF